MTQATVNGKQVKMTMWEKATLLNVSQIPGEPGYSVSSGSDEHTSYRVSEDCGTCRCDAYGMCCHRIAARAFKASRQPSRPATCDHCGGYHASSTCYL